MEKKKWLRILAGVLAVFVLGFAVYDAYTELVQSPQDDSDDDDGDYQDDQPTNDDDHKDGDQDSEKVSHEFTVLDHKESTNGVKKQTIEI